MSLVSLTLHPLQSINCKIKKESISFSSSLMQHNLRTSSCSSLTWYHNFSTNTNLLQGRTLTLPAPAPEKSHRHSPCSFRSGGFASFLELCLGWGYWCTRTQTWTQTPFGAGYYALWHISTIFEHLSTVFIGQPSSSQAAAETTASGSCPLDLAVRSKHISLEMARVCYQQISLDSSRHSEEEELLEVLWRYKMLPQDLGHLQAEWGNCFIDCCMCYLPPFFALL